MQEVLGRGGMGAVYLAHQSELDRQVAIKLLPIESSADEHLVERFRREARTLAKLNHPGIVTLHEAGVTNAGHFYFVMEYVRGRPLNELIHAGRLSTGQVIEIIRQVCDALAYAHAQGVIHRDIKPSNILIDDQGNAHVADFGLARTDQPKAMALSQTGAFMGTPEYAAPEQAKDAAHVDHRADIYSLGVLLYEMLTGELPRGIFQPPSAKAGADQRFDKVVNRALQERPEDRYQQASDLKAAVSAKPATKSHAWLWAAVIVLLSGIGWMGWQMAAPDLPVKAPSQSTSETVAQAQAPAIAVAPPPPMTEDTPKPSSALPKEPPPAPPEVSTLPKLPSMQPASPPAAAPIAPTGTVAKVWSLSPVSPGLLPPSEYLGEWEVAKLTETGGAIITKSGALVDWREGKALQHTAKDSFGGHFSGKNLLTTNSAILITGGRGGLLLFGVFRDGPFQVTDDVVTAFDSMATGHIPLVNRKGELVAIGIDPKYSDLVTFPNPTGQPPVGMAMTTDREVWSLTRDGQVLLHTVDSAIPRLENVKSIASTGTGVLALSKGGQVLALDGAPEAPERIIEPQQLITARGHAAVIDSKGKVTVWGPAVEDSPQRFSLPEGHKHLAISPKGVIATW